MALDLTATYPGQVDNSDPDYPFGKAQNRSDADAADGFPLEKSWVNDTLGFHQSLLTQGNQVPSGDPDKVGASQYLYSIEHMISRRAIAQWQGTSAIGFDATEGPRLVHVTENGLIYTTGLISGGESRIYRSAAGKLPNSCEWEDVSPSGLGTGGSATTHCAIISGEGAILFAGTGSTIGNNIRRSTTEGDNWSTVACHTGAGGYFDLAYDGVNFFGAPAAAGSNKLGISANGSSWAAVTGTFDGSSWATADEFRVRTGPVGHVIVFSGDVADKVNYSDDSGDTWTESGDVFGSSNVVDVRYSTTTEKWYALSFAGEVSESEDGTTWTVIGDTGLFNVSHGEAYRLAIVGDILIASGRNLSRTAVSISTDRGASWTLIHLGQLEDNVEDTLATCLTTAHGAVYLMQASQGGANHHMYYTPRMGL